MTDGELCLELLQKIYDDHSRPDGFVYVPFGDTPPRIGRLLHQEGKIEWKPSHDFAMARLMPAGRNMIEHTPSLPLVVMNDHSINGSNNTIGSHNRQSTKSSIGKIISAKDHSIVSERSAGNGWIASFGAALLSFFGIGSAQ